MIRLNDDKTIKELLLSDRTYYVSPSGSDSANGLTIDTPFLTPSKARDTIRKLDGNGFNVTVQFADGTYNLINPVEWSGFLSIGTLYLTGNIASPSNILIQSSANNFIATGLFVFRGCLAQVNGFQFINNQPNGFCLSLTNSANVVTQNNWFAGASNLGISLTKYSLLRQSGNFIISGSYLQFIAIDSSQADFQNTGVCTLSGTPSFALRFLYGFNGVFYWIPTSFTWSGSAVGTQYVLEANSILEKYSIAGNLPGNVGGTIASGSQIL